MRLICPNCGAQYEVPDEVVPQSGRDVQCSSCGHTWFQHHPDHDRGLAEDLEEPLPDEEWTPPTPEPEPEPASDPEPEPEPAPEPEPDPTPEPRPARQPDTPPRRALDPQIADVLREEARQEEAARATERHAGNLESQPELGLDAPAELDESERRAREARQRMARMRGDTAEQPPAALAAALHSASRRDLLPNIDEINSSLRAAEEPRGSAVDAAEQAEGAPRRRGGFQRGFRLALLVALILLAIYIMTPRLTDTVPALAPLLDGYASWVDGLRAGLNTMLANLLIWLDGLASTASE